MNRAQKSKLGRSTWHLLHSIAECYPENPTRIQRQSFLNLIDSLSILYPCKECSSYLGIFKDKIRTTNRKELILSLCEFHNLINYKLNKPTINCQKYLKQTSNPHLSSLTFSNTLTKIQNYVIDLFNLTNIFK
ncbi:mitochondrial FAD-linked sulfhydryl oxidase [Nematocida sp. AWRm80]|nr:mitochondrial FAD-linked sulfhydryl oxidase [Nematocida sp. AWRm80]